MAIAGIATLFILGSSALAQNASFISIPSQLQYLLSAEYSGNRTLGFTATNTTNATINTILSSAATATFISYDAEFDELLGPSPTAQLIAPSDSPYAFEGAVWVPERNEIWFTSDLQKETTSISILDLSNDTVRTPSLYGDAFVNPNGGYYFNGLVYFTYFGNATLPSGIVSVDPASGLCTIVVNSNFGIPFNSVDDLTWVKSRAYTSGSEKEAYMFFTDPSYRIETKTPLNPPQQPNAVWRFSPSSGLLLPVISRSDISEGNGISVNAEMTKLYVADAPATYIPGGVDGTLNGSPAIFSFDLTEDGFPVNKRLFGITAEGISDGIHIDDDGRVWTGEGNGIVVRNKMGKTIGVFNAKALLSGRYDQPIAQVALAGDQVIILALDRIWKVQLTKSIIGPGRFQL